MQSPLVTNVLLSVIAVLLLVLVIQNGMSSSRGYGPRPIASAPYHNPHSSGGRGSSTPMMMAAPMFFQALRAFPEGCEGKNILAECNSPAAEAIKQEINSLAEQGKGPREVFDYVINKYGLDALTPEAQRIRSMRTQ